VLTGPASAVLSSRAAFARGASSRCTCSTSSRCLRRCVPAESRRVSRPACGGAVGRAEIHPRASNPLLAARPEQAELLRPFAPTRSTPRHSQIGPTPYLLIRVTRTSSQCSDSRWCADRMAGHRCDPAASRLEAQARPPQRCCSLRSLVRLRACLVRWAETQYFPRGSTMTKRSSIARTTTSTLPRARSNRGSRQGCSPVEENGVPARHTPAPVGDVRRPDADCDRPADLERGRVVA
jgi:hypothetical protein